MNNNFILTNPLSPFSPISIYRESNNERFQENTYTQRTERHYYQQETQFSSQNEQPVSGELVLTVLFVMFFIVLVSFLFVKYDGFDSYSEP